MAANLTNLQNLNLDGEIGEILQKSANEWLNYEEIAAIFAASDGLPRSEEKPPVRIAGVFLYDNESRYRDGLQWDYVNEERRRSCRSFQMPGGQDIGVTIARHTFPAGGQFCRRTHHMSQFHGELALVHYLYLGFFVGGQEEEASDDDSDDDSIQGEKNDAEPEPDDDAPPSSSSEEDDVRKDPDYFPGRRKMVPCGGYTAKDHGLLESSLHRPARHATWKRRIVDSDMGSLLAGAKFRGDFEERFKAVLKEVSASNGQIIHVGATGGAMDASNLLKPMLGRGELRCIGATTLTEYRKYIEKDPALERRFQQVFCGQPSVEDTISILRGLRERYELHHGVKISDGSLVSAAVLSDRYITERFLPDKAIDLVDEAAAKLRMEITSKPTELDGIDRAVVKLEMEKLSLKNDTDKGSKERLQKIEDDLTTLKGKQKELNEQWEKEKSIMTKISSLKEEIDRVNLEYESAEREYDLNRAAELKYGTLTSLQRQLEEVEKSLKNFRESGQSLLREEVTDLDIAEIVSKWTGIPLSKLVGAPPGYVGYEEGGQLTEVVRRRPYSVVLFDEIEKAHHDVFNILLQLLDDGRITDSQGRTVSFTNCVVIMTSNIGSHHILETLRNNEDSKEAVHEIMKRQVVELARQTFRPEFMNRIDEYIVFQPLDSKEISRIVELHMQRVKNRLEQKKINLEYTKEAVDLLAQLGFDPNYGARPVKRVIQQMVENEIAVEVLKGGYAEEDSILLDLVKTNNKLVIKKLENNAHGEEMAA